MMKFVSLQGNMFRRQKAKIKGDKRGEGKQNPLILLLLERVRLMVRVHGLIVNKKFIEGGLLS